MNAYKKAMKSGAAKAAAIAALSAALVALGGCIADSAEDTDLPWATNKSWEGMAPLPSGMLNQYD